MIGFDDCGFGFVLKASLDRIFGVCRRSLPSLKRGVQNPRFPAIVLLPMGYYTMLVQ